MSVLGQKQTFAVHEPMSALPPLADIGAAQINVCYGPMTNIQGLPGPQRKLQPARRINQARLDLNVA